MKKYIVIGLLGLCSVLVIGAYAFFKQSPTLYQNEYTSLCQVEQFGSRLTPGICHNVRSSVKMSEKYVEIVIGNDKLAGIPKGVINNYVLVVRTYDSMTVYLTKVLPSSLEPALENEILIVSFQNRSIFLSNDDHCEKIQEVISEINQK